MSQSTYRRLCWALYAVVLGSLVLTAMSVAASYGRAPVLPGWVLRMALFGGVLIPQAAYLASQAGGARRAPEMLWRREDAWMHILFAGILVCFVSTMHRGAPWHAATVFLPIVFVLFSVVLLITRVRHVSAALKAART